MNVPPSAVLVFILVAAVANLLIVLAVYMRSRADRTRRFVQVDGFLSSSYGNAGSRDDTPASGDGWIASGDRWLTSRERSATGGAGEQADPVDPAVVPFEYPAPSSLEQRSLDLEELIDESDWVKHDPPDEDGDDDADMNGTEMQVTDADEVAAVDAVDGVVAIPPDGAASASRGRDPLTGLLDAMAFEEAMSHEEAREQRYGRPATVIVFELDGLAKLVDRLGADPGDRIETALGDSIKRLARRADYAARLERGRYAVLLPETDEVAAINYVERIRRACDLWLESGAIAMRLAIGWASTTGDAGLKGAVRVATDRMRVELRRNARQAGDGGTEADALGADVDTGDGGPAAAAEAAAGL